MLRMAFCKAFGGYRNFFGGDWSERLIFDHPPRSLQKDSRGTCLPRRRGFFVPATWVCEMREGVGEAGNLVGGVSGAVFALALQLLVLFKSKHV
jgi:hypothetical protein